MSEHRTASGTCIPPISVNPHLSRISIKCYQLQHLGKETSSWFSLTAPALFYANPGQLFWSRSISYIPIFHKEYTFKLNLKNISDKRFQWSTNAIILGDGSRNLKRISRKLKCFYSLFVKNYNIICKQMGQFYHLNTIKYDSYSRVKFKVCRFKHESKFKPSQNIHFARQQHRYFKLSI